MLLPRLVSIAVAFLLLAGFIITFDGVVAWALLGLAILSALFFLGTFSGRGSSAASAAATAAALTAPPRLAPQDWVMADLVFETANRLSGHIWRSVEAIGSLSDDYYAIPANLDEEAESERRKIARMVHNASPYWRTIAILNELQSSLFEERRRLGVAWQPAVSRHPTFVSDDLCARAIEALLALRSRREFLDTENEPDIREKAKSALILDVAPATDPSGTLYRGRIRS